MKSIIKKIEDYDIMLKKHIEEKDFVKINRSLNKPDANISGFILKMSKDFILIQKELEFYLNGYSIIRKDNFDSLRHNKFDKTFKKILIEESIFDNYYGINKEINIESWQNIFKDLKVYDYHVIIECENLEEPSFDIGPIKRVNKNSVSIQYYDPTGLLDSTLTTIKYENITTVSFDDRYTNVFRKYLRERKLKKKK